jgi:dienelactone hydrolase
VDHRHPELLGPLFVKHGYLFLYLFRRGDGLSAGQGVPSADRMDSAGAAGGQVARNDLQLRLMEGDELNDVLAGLAFLRARPDVQAGRLAVVGDSFGGSLTLWSLSAIARCGQPSLSPSAGTAGSALRPYAPGYSRRPD